LAERKSGCDGLAPCVKPILPLRFSNYQESDQVFITICGLLGPYPTTVKSRAREMENHYSSVIGRG
jgi:hypothetical protein